jgi:hypothetical protein
MTYGQSQIELGDEKVQALLDEFAYIMNIPEEERTTEQWNRAIAIIFEIYYSYDLKALLNELETEVSKYKDLGKELEKLYNELDTLYKQEQKIYNNLLSLYGNLNELYTNYESIDNSLGLNFFGMTGYTYNTGLSLGLGITYNIDTSLFIGGLFSMSSNFNGTSYYTIGLIFGWGF